MQAQDKLYKVFNFYRRESWYPNQLKETTTANDSPESEMKRSITPNHTNTNAVGIGFINEAYQEDTKRGEGMLRREVRVCYEKR